MPRNMKAKVVPLWERDAVAPANHRPASETLKSIGMGGPRQFPVVSTLPRLPVMIPDEILDYYGWVFCQGGFLNLHMTFEQFLTVVAAVSPSGLCPEYEDEPAAASLD
jgi:hypothetical protein